MTGKPAIYAPQRRYTEKMRAAGMVPVTVWVPAANREDAIKHAAKMRERAEAEEKDG